MVSHIRFDLLLSLLWAVSVGLLWWRDQGGLSSISAERLYRLELLVWLLVGGLFLLARWVRAARLWLEHRSKQSRRSNFSTVIGADMTAELLDESSGALTRRGLCDWLVAIQDPHASMIAMRIHVTPSTICSNEGKTFHALLLRHLRPTDAVVRWDESGFLLLCPGLQTHMSLVFAERIRDCVHAEEDWLEESTPSCSIGISKGSLHDIKSTLQRAEKALTKAKESGGNKVVDDFHP